MLIGQLINEIGLLLDEILSFISIIFMWPVVWPVAAKHKKDSTRQNPKFDFFLFFPCGRRRRSRKEKAKPKKKSSLRTMPQATNDVASQLVSRSRMGCIGSSTFLMLRCICVAYASRRNRCLNPLMYISLSLVHFGNSTFSLWLLRAFYLFR
jgi:hypothetical protein